MFTKKTFLSTVAFLSISVIFFGLSLPRCVGASDPYKDTKGYGIESARGVAELPKTVAGADSIPGLIGVIVGLALSLVAVVFFILILYSGAVWMTAMGNAERVTKAKTTLEASAIGLVIVLAAYAIAKFVFENLK